MVDVMALLAAEVRDEGQKCHTCRWLESREADERKRWEVALADDGSFAKAHLARAMAKAQELAPSDERVPGPDSIGNHRSGHQRNVGRSGRR